MLQGQRLWLMPQELVYIPIKFQAWQHGAVRLDDATADNPHLPAPGSMPAKELAALPIARRTIMLSVLNVKQELVQGLELCVRPQPYVLDQTFRFHQSEHEFLKTTIRLQGVRWHASAALQQVPPSMPSSWANHHAPPPAPLPCSTSVAESQYNAAAGGVNYRKWDGIGGTGVEQLLKDRKSVV